MRLLLLLLREIPSENCSSDGFSTLVLTLTPPLGGGPSVLWERVMLSLLLLPKNTLATVERARAEGGRPVTVAVEVGIPGGERLVDSIVPAAGTGAADV